MCIFVKATVSNIGSKGIINKPDNESNMRPCWICRALLF